MRRRMPEGGEEDEKKEGTSCMLAVGFTLPSAGLSPHPVLRKERCGTSSLLEP